MGSRKRVHCRCEGLNIAPAPDSPLFFPLTTPTYLVHGPPPAFPRSLHIYAYILRCAMIWKSYEAAALLSVISHISKRNQTFFFFLFFCILFNTHINLGSTFFFIFSHMHKSSEKETSSDCIKLHESNWKLGDWNNQLLWQFAISFHSPHAQCDDDECNEATNIALQRKRERAKGKEGEEDDSAWLTVCQFVWHLNYSLSGCNWTTAEQK